MVVEVGKQSDARRCSQRPPALLYTNGLGLTRHNPAAAAARPRAVHYPDDTQRGGCMREEEQKGERAAGAVHRLADHRLCILPIVG